ncbi:SCO family protein [Ramlibacter sp. USB13]|uniref:SCO family protein n=1 Tax=Ramlibacter cellulosilyticus TaxID=2764187 RepID=A0A923SG89_9BURK|nr:SCO family protein [Ramlibacter cellulosilyticus]MBC5784692.1 SCO family protein [Ramlibacter cellulosilyticus]
MLRTLLSCTALLYAAYAAAAWVTHDFQAWTAEGARRLEVARVPVPAPPVSLQGTGVPHDGLQEVLANGRDVTIVDFVYTHCETLCLSLGTVFQQMQATLQQAPAGSAADRVKLLSISFDPERDTPDVLAAYASRMGADPRTWRFARVPGTADTRRLLDAFRVVVVPFGQGDFEHNAALLVVAPDGRLMRVFDIAQQQMALDYAVDLAEGGR